MFVKVLAVLKNLKSLAVDQFMKKIFFDEKQALVAHLVDLKLKKVFTVKDTDKTVSETSFKVR